MTGELILCHLCNKPIPGVKVKHRGHPYHVVCQYYAMYPTKKDYLEHLKKIEDNLTHSKAYGHTEVDVRVQILRKDLK